MKSGLISLPALASCMPPYITMRTGSLAARSVSELVNRSKWETYFLHWNNCATTFWNQTWPGVYTLTYKQSSFPGGSNWTHWLPKLKAFRTHFHGWAFCGGYNRSDIVHKQNRSWCWIGAKVTLNRKSPIGGWAYGMPRNAKYCFSSNNVNSILPRIRPYSVCTITVLSRRLASFASKNMTVQTHIKISTIIEVVIEHNRVIMEAGLEEFGSIAECATETYLYWW